MLVIRGVSLANPIFRYLSGTLELGITFTADSDDNLVGYTDSDEAGLIDGRKSTGGYVFMLSGGDLSDQSKLQSTVALSSTEAEYMAITEAGKEALWIARFLACLGFAYLAAAKGSPVRGSPTSMLRMVVGDPEPTPQRRKLLLPMRQSPRAK